MPTSLDNEFRGKVLQASRKVGATNLKNPVSFKLLIAFGKVRVKSLVALYLIKYLIKIDL